MKPDTIKYAMLGLTFVLAGTLSYIANKYGEKNTKGFNSIPTNNFQGRVVDGHHIDAPGAPVGRKILITKVGSIKQGSEVLIGGEWVKVTRRLGTTLWVKPIAKPISG